jgi:hypothetical protein
MLKSFLLSLICFVILESANPQAIDFSTIPKSGTILVYTHQDDDLIWMLPFWNISEKFIGAAMPASPGFADVVHNQQMYMDNNGYDINYESSWIHPWGLVTDAEYVNYYWNNDVNYWYLEKDHVRAFWNEKDTNLTRREINKIKAKIEQYIADPGVSRIITHNNWGEYGHTQHKAVSAAVRELAVKYRKDVWMLGVNNNSFIDVPVPAGLTYTMGNFDGNLFNAVRNIYLYPQNWWTWSKTFTPSGNHVFIKVVDAGIDKSNILTGATVTESGPHQFESGSYIFDGDDDYMTLAGNNNTSFTIAMRIRPDEIKSMDISKMTEYPLSTKFDRSFYMQSDGRITARIYDGQSRTVTSTSTLSTGDWTHILMTGDGSTLKIYINGIREDSINTGAAISNYVSPEFLLGQAQETTSFFRGQISDVRLYDFVMPDSEITSQFNPSSITSHSIFCSAGTGGTISPPGTILVNQGGSQTYTITPNSGFKISEVLVDNVSVGVPSSYTFNKVTTVHTIAATFSSITSSIALYKPTFYQSYQSGCESFRANDADGTNNSYWAASPYSQWWIVDLGSNYDLSSVLIRNYVDGTRYYQYNIQASTDNVTYTKIAEKNNTNKAVDAGDAYNVNATARYLKVIMTYNSANGGVHITDFRAYGTLSGPSGTYTITSSADIGCSISPPGVITLNQGTSKTFTITANDGYQISDVLVDNISVGAVSTYTFSDVTSSHTIYAKTFSAATPTYEIDYYNELTNKVIPSTDEYSYNSDMSNAVNGNGQKLALIPGKDVYFRTKAGNGLNASYIQHLVVLTRPPVPSVSIDFAYEKSVEIIGSTIEYSTSSSYTNPVSGNGGKISLTPGQDLYLWVKATNGSFYSLVTHLVVPNRPAKPSITIDYFNEKSSVVSSALDWSVNSTMTSAISGTDAPLTLTPGTDLFIRVKPTSGSFSSDVQTLEVPERPATPSISIDFENEKTVESIDPAIEYSTSDLFTDTVNGDGSEVSLITGKDMYFRVKATSNSFYSVVSHLSVPTRPPGPSIAFDYPNEMTSVISSSLEYSDDISMGSAIGGGDTAISVTPGKNLYLRVKACSNAFNSEIQCLIVPERPQTPNYQINYRAVKTMQIVPSTDEYSLQPDMSGAKNGENTAIDIDPGKDLYFRVKAEDSSFCSLIQHLNVKQRPAPPQFHIDYVNEESLEPVDTSVDYSTSADFSYASSGKGAPLRLIPGEILYFRIKSTDSTYSSQRFQLDVPGKPFLEYSGEDTLRAAVFTVQASLDSSITDFDLSDISVTNGHAQNLQDGNTFDVIPDNKGEVQVVIPPNTFRNGNFGSNNIVVYFEGFKTGVKDFGKNELMVYPVPSNSGKINVYISIPGKYKIELFSPKGELIREIILNDSGLQSIDLNDCKGLYYLRITSGDIQGIRKIILY